MRKKQLHERFFPDLKEVEQIKIRAAIESRVNLQVKVVDEWIDDHLPCVGAIINGVAMGFWWLSGKGVGALHFSHDSQAQKIIREMIREQMEEEEVPEEENVDGKGR